MAEHPDAGILAVARVRGVREQDSRVGLRMAAAEERAAAENLQDLEARLRTGPVGTADVASFLAIRTSHGALAADAALAREALAAARLVAETARDHWQRDKTRLSAVELLLERRAEERRAERARREATELDDLVSMRWVRTHREEVGSS